MARIKIECLTKDRQISKKMMKKIFGSAVSVDHPCLCTGYHLGIDPYVLSDPPPRTPPQVSDWFGGVSSCVDTRK